GSGCPVVCGHVVEQCVPVQLLQGCHPDPAVREKFQTRLADLAWRSHQRRCASLQVDYLSLGRDGALRVDGEKENLAVGKRRGQEFRRSWLVDSAGDARWNLVAERRTLRD